GTGRPGRPARVGGAGGGNPASTRSYSDSRNRSHSSRPSPTTSTRMSSARRSTVSSMSSPMKSGKSGPILPPGSPISSRRCSPSDSESGYRNSPRRIPSSIANRSFWEGVLFGRTGGAYGGWRLARWTCRDGESEGRPQPRLALEPDLAAVELDELSTQGQSQPCALDLLVRCSHLAELLEYRLLVLRG